MKCSGWALRGAFIVSCVGGIRGVSLGIDIIARSFSLVGVYSTLMTYTRRALVVKMTSSDVGISTARQGLYGVGRDVLLWEPRQALCPFSMCHHLDVVGKKYQIQLVDECKGLFLANQQEHMFHFFYESPCHTRLSSVPVFCQFCQFCCFFVQFLIRRLGLSQASTNVLTWIPTSLPRSSSQRLGVSNYFSPSIHDGWYW